MSGVLVHGIDVTERTLASLLAVGQRSALELAVSDAPLGDVLDVLAHTAEEYSGGAGLAAIRLADGAARAPAPRGRPVAAAGVHGRARRAAGRRRRAGPDALAAASGETGRRWPTSPPTRVSPALSRTGAGARPARLPRDADPGAVGRGAGRVLLVSPRTARRRRDDEYEALALLANTASLVIGQRHEAQERMAAEERSHNILESISEGFLAIDSDWRVSYANHAAERLIGIARDAAGRRRVLGRVRRRCAAARSSRACAAARPSASHVKFDAYYDPFGRWLEINSCPTPDGGIALYFRDESERRLAEEGIRRLAAVAEQSPDFIGIATPDATGMFLNPAGRAAGRHRAGRRHFATTRWSTSSRPRAASSSIDVVLPALNGAPARWEGELRFAHLATGAVAPVYFKGFAVRDDRGEIIGLATVTRDITEQKRAEDELRRIAADLSEADHRKSEFLATLAHELRNPLAPIRTGLDLLRMAPPDPAAMARVVGMMDRQLGHLIHLVNDLLDVARITRGKIELKKEPVELQTLVSMALETSVALIEASGHTLEVQLPDEPIMLDVDTTRIVQVLSNLLNNAAKYTPGRRAHRA